MSLIDKRSACMRALSIMYKKRMGQKRTISKACETMRTAMSFLPLFRPFIMREFVSRSMIGH